MRILTAAAAAFSKASPAVLSTAVSALCVLALATAGAKAQSYPRFEAYAGWSPSLVGDLVLENTLANGAKSDNADSAGAAAFQGFGLSAAWNFTRWWGAVLDFSAAFQAGKTAYPGTLWQSSFPVIIPAIRTDTRQRYLAFLAGVRCKDNASDALLIPFGHVLVGMATQTLAVDGSDGGDGGEGEMAEGFYGEATSPGFMAALGAGLDVRVHRHVDLRLLQIDYTPVLRLERDLVGRGDTRRGMTSRQDIKVKGGFSNHARLAVGLTIH